MARSSKNLMQQVSRQNDTFRHLLKKSGSGIDVYSCLVFINPAQMIYSLPYGRNILTASSLGKFLDRVIRDNRHSYGDLKAFLESRRLAKSMYDGAVTVGLDELRGGVFCEDCYGEMKRVNRKQFACTDCDAVLDLLGAAQRLVNELRMLNDSWPIDSGVISNYSGRQISSSYIRRQKQLGHLHY
ncbi:hypothetical protein [Lacicoccus alkaliphilus]|uniref:Uncharacterized protein n=1 Tax=Lacicoccus alkaliphilus DSM 16010 TaxID=1123231 RepID=A0A1M7FDI0_9BACL|nr:hypothetical protein [Salinicoccus alkaliphilus]SHM01727.1 hypothetical protein SAMN02745189_01407 [Salinicoccus alkaliphilus DSM 16010]